MFGAMAVRRRSNHAELTGLRRRLGQSLLGLAEGAVLVRLVQDHIARRAGALSRLRRFRAPTGDLERRLTHLRVGDLESTEHDVVLFEARAGVDHLADDDRVQVVH